MPPVQCAATINEYSMISLLKDNRLNFDALLADENKVIAVLRALADYMVSGQLTLTVKGVEVSPQLWDKSSTPIDKGLWVDLVLESIIQDKQTIETVRNNLIFEALKINYHLNATEPKLSIVPVHCD